MGTMLQRHCGAPTSSQRLTDDAKKDDDDSSEESNTPPKSRHDSEGVSIRPNEDEGDDADFAAEPTILDTTEGQDNFLTARTSKNDSEEELLSQPDNGDSLFLSQVGKSGGSDSDGSATDISKTQQYPLPTSALTNTSRQSCSSYEDENDGDSKIALIKMVTLYRLCQKLQKMEIRARIIPIVVLITKLRKSFLR